MINRVVLIGRLTRDPELRVTTSGKSVCDFSVAVTKRIKPQDGSPDADFFRVNAWGKTAEFVSNYLTKGRLVGVDGRLQSRRFTGSDGNNREIIEIVADHVHPLDRPREEEEYFGSQEKAGAPLTTASKVSEYDPFADE